MKKHKEQVLQKSAKDDEIEGSDNVEDRTTADAESMVEVSQLSEFALIRVFI